MLLTAGMNSRLVHILAYSTVHNLAPQCDPDLLFTYARTCFCTSRKLALSVLACIGFLVLRKKISTFAIELSPTFSIVTDIRG